MYKKIISFIYVFIFRQGLILYAYSYITQVDLELRIFLPGLLRYWIYRHVPPCLAAIIIIVVVVYRVSVCSLVSPQTCYIVQADLGLRVFLSSLPSAGNTRINLWYLLQKFNSYCLKVGRSKTQALTYLVYANIFIIVNVFFLYPHMTDSSYEFSGSLFIRILILIMMALLLQTSYLGPFNSRIFVYTVKMCFCQGTFWLV